MVDPRIEQLATWYQPVVDLDTGHVAGFEALSRFVAPDGTARSAGALRDELERDPEPQYALIRRLIRPA